MNVWTWLLFTDTIPQSKILLFVFFFFKFSAIIVNVNSNEHHTSPAFSEKHIFTTLANYSRLNRKNWNHINIEILNNILCLILLYPIVSSFIIFIKKKNDKLTPRFSLFIRASSYIFLLIILFSQHIIECWSFNLCLTFYTITSDPDVLAVLEHEKSKLLFSNYIQIPVNWVFIVIINIYIFIFFKLFNTPFISKHYVFNHNHGTPFLVLMIILFNNQCTHYYDWIFNSALYRNITSSINIILLIILLGMYLQEYIVISFYNILLLLFILISIISGSVSLIMNCASWRDSNHVYWYYLLKYIFTISLSRILIIKYLNYQTNKYNMITKNNWFKLHKESCDYFPHFLSFFSHQNYLKEIVGVLNLLNDHRMECPKGEECEMKYIDWQNCWEQVQKYKKEKGLMDILLWIQTEIHNFISANLQENTKSNTYLQSIALLHCDYTFLMLKNEYLALYLIDGYTHTIYGMSYEYRLYFHKLKHNILNDITSKTRGNTNERYIKYQKFMKYYREIIEINKNIFDCVENYQRVIEFKWMYTAPERTTNKANLSLRRNNKNLQILFDTCMTIENSLTYIQQSLLTNFSSDQKGNLEIFFLLTHFYKIINNSIPQELKGIVEPLLEFTPITKMVSSFTKSLFEHPMIINMSNSDIKEYSEKNRILYISQKLVRILSYKCDDLLDKDFHILLPEYFRKEHTWQIEKHIYIQKRWSVSKTAFLVDYNNYYIKVNVNGKFLPQMENELIVILDISWLPQSTRSFAFILDAFFDNLAWTKTFTNEFFLDNEILNSMKITFCNFFGWKQDKIEEFFTEDVKKTNDIAFFSGWDIDKTLAIKDTINWYRKTNEYKSINDMYFNNTRGKVYKKLKITKPKNNWKNVLHRIHLQMEESEMNQDVRDKLTCLYNKLLNTQDFDFKQNEEVFHFSFSLRVMGRLPYYYVKVKDKSDFNYNIITSNNYFESGWLNSVIFDDNTKIGKNWLLSGQFVGVGGSYLNVTNNNTTSNNSISNNQQSKVNINNYKKNLNYYANNSSYKSVKDFNTQAPNISNSNVNNSLNNILNNNNNSISNSTGGLLSSTMNSNPWLLNSTKDKSPKAKKVTYAKEVKPANSYDVYISKKATLNLIQTIFNNCSLILILIGLFCFCFNLYYKNYLMKFVEDALRLNLFAWEIKEYMLEIANLSLSAFFILDNLEKEEYQGTKLNKDFLKSIISVRSSNWFLAYNKILFFIESYSTYDRIIWIQEMIFEKQIYRKLQNNYPIEYESDFNTELYFIHFHMGFIKSDLYWRSCKIKDKFWKRTCNESITEDEALFYYINNNWPSNWMDKIEELILLGHYFISEQWESCEFRATLFNSACLIVGVWLFLFSNGFVFLQQLKIKLALNLFFEPNDKTHKLELKLFHFKKIVESNDEEVWLQFERFALEIDNNDNNTKKVNPQKQLLIRSTKRQKTFKSMKKVQGNISSKRMTPSSKMILRSSLKYNGDIDKPSITKPVETSNKEEASTDIDATKRFSYYSINIIAKCYGILLLWTVTYCAILMINILQTLVLYSYISITLNMSNIFLDFIPSLNEILLYYRVSIIKNNHNFLTRKIEDFPRYWIYFSPGEVDISIDNDERYKTWNESKMLFLYYRTNYQFKLLNEIEDSNKNVLLSANTNFADGWVGNSACSTIADSYIKHISNYEDGWDYDLILNACLSWENGANNRQTGGSIINFFTYLFDEYLDFVKRADQKDMDTVIQFLSYNLSNSISRQMIMIINVSWVITSFLINQDIDNWFIMINKREFTFQAIEIVMSFVFAAIIVCFVMIQLTRQTKGFEHIIQKLNIVMR